MTNQYQFVYLFESLSIWSKDYGKTITVYANSNKEAIDKAASLGFDWGAMSRYLNK